jgi:hypothetical protein
MVKGYPVKPNDTDVVTCFKMFLTGSNGYSNTDLRFKPGTYEIPARRVAMEKSLLRDEMSLLRSITTEVSASSPWYFVMWSL